MFPKATPKTYPMARLLKIVFDASSIPIQL